MSGKLQGFEQSYLEAKFTTPESTLKAPHYRDGNFKFYKKNYTQVLLKKILKNDISRKVESFEQTYLGKICNPMRVPSQIPITGLRSSKFWTFLTSIFFFFLKISEKIIKNVISRKLQGFEQSYLEAKIATPESTLTEPHRRDGNIKFCDFFISKFSEFFFFENLKKTSYLELQGFGYSYMEVRIAKPGKTLRASNYWVANYKLNELKTEFKRENGKSLNHCNIRYSLNMKKFFCSRCKKNYVEKAETWRDSEARI